MVTSISWTNLTPSLLLAYGAVGCSGAPTTEAGTSPVGMGMAGAAMVSSAGGSTAQATGSQGGAAPTGTMLPTGTGMTTGNAGSAMTVTGMTGSMATGTVVGSVTGSGGAPMTSMGGPTATAGVSSGGAAPVDLCNPTLSGQEFYMLEGACVSCHGPDALGLENLGPEARHVDEGYARWIIRNGRKDHEGFPSGMTGYEAECVTDTMIDELIAFLNGFPKPTTGEALYVVLQLPRHGRARRRDGA